MKILERTPPGLRVDRPATRLDHDETNARVVTFHLSPGQSVPEHSSTSTVVLQVVEGEGVFSGGDGTERSLGPGDVAVYAPGEVHSVKAATGTLHFRAIIAPGPER